MRFLLILATLSIISCTTSTQIQPETAITQAKRALIENNPKLALKILGDDVRASGASIETVDPNIAILFAWGYRDSGDFDQALAWYSQAFGNKLASEETRSIAESGVEDTIKRIPSEQYESISNRWRGSSFVSRFFNNTQAPSYENDQTPQAITVALPLTGRFMKLGDSVRKGLELAELTEINLIDESARDNQTPLQAVLGPITSDLVPEFANFARSKGVPLLNLAKNEAPEKFGVVELGVTPRSQVEPLIKYAATKLALTKFGIVYPDSEQGRDYLNAFSEVLKLLGLTPTFELSFPKDDLNSLPQLAVQAEEKPDVEAILFADKISNAAYFFSLIREETRNAIRPMGLASWANKTELKNSQAVLSRAIFVSPFQVNSLRPQVKAFITAYQSKFNEQPDILSAQGYDIGMLVRQALEKQQSERAQFIYALSRSTPFYGVTGTIRITPTGEVNREYPVVEFLDGQIAER